MPVADHVILAVAGQQHWLATRRQLREAGLSDPAISRRIRSGLLVPIHPGVLRLSAAPPSVEQRLLAGCLAVGPGAVVSHRSAAAQWGVPRLQVGCVEVLAPDGRHPRSSGLIVHRTGDLAPDHCTELDGVPITTPERTLADLGAVARRGLVVRAAEEWLVKGLVTGPSMLAMLDTVAQCGRPGVAALRWALDQLELADQRPDSTGEMLFRRLVTRFGLPVPEYHVLIDVGPHRFEADFAWPERRAIVEIDGRDPHSRMVAADHDRWRQNLLEDAGWRFRRYTSGQLRRSPAGVAAGVLRWLAALAGVARAA